AYCATAHHRDDQVETLLMTMFRGRHPEIMRPIPDIRDCYIRPFIHASKSDIEFFLQIRDLPFRLDRSNSNNKYQRNFVRNQVIPTLRELNPGIEDRLLEMRADMDMYKAFVAAQMQDFCKAAVKESARCIEILLVGEEKRFFGPHFRLFFRHYLSKKGISGADIRGAEQLIEAAQGKQYLCDRATFLRHHRRILIRFPEMDRFSTGEALEIDAPRNGRTQFSFAGRTIHTEMLDVGPGYEHEIRLINTGGMHMMDADAVEFPITVRHWKAGDRMRPLGMKGRKKLSDIFVDEGFDRFLKSDALVFEDRKQIICLSRFRIADGVKLEAGTKKILTISIEFA
ncbi:MAG: tRNA lysidine(34) synthetase TilS, partial [Bacteroidota bacterium]